jgi:hypothetical protein
MDETNIFFQIIDFFEAIGPHAITFSIPLLITALGDSFLSDQG